MAGRGKRGGRQPSAGTKVSVSTAYGMGFYAMPQTWITSSLSGTAERMTSRICKAFAALTTTLKRAVRIAVERFLQAVAMQAAFHLTQRIIGDSQKLWGNRRGV